MLKWRDIKKEIPKNGEDCLTKMKHGIIQGMYNEDSNTFTQYYCRDMEWYGNT